MVDPGRLADPDHAGRPDGDRRRRRPHPAARPQTRHLPARRQRPRPAVGGREPGRRGRCGEPGRRALDRVLRPRARREGRPRRRPAHAAAGDRHAHDGPWCVDRARGGPGRLLDRRRPAARRPGDRRRRGGRRVPQHAAARRRDRPERRDRGRLGRLRQGPRERALVRLPRDPRRPRPAPVARPPSGPRALVGSRVRRSVRA